MNNNDNNASTLCPVSLDASFGPVLGGDGHHDCRAGGFDFTLVFEQSILVILPASLLLLFGPVRLVHLLGKRGIKIHERRFRSIKLFAIGTLAVLQLALLILWSTRHASILNAAKGVRGGRGEHAADRLVYVSVAAACVSLASTVMCLFLSYAEHVRSPRPSSLLNLFFLVTMLFDATVLRTLWLLSSNATSAIALGRAFPGVATGAMSLKAVLVILEAREKTNYLRDHNSSGVGIGDGGGDDRADDRRLSKSYSPAETAGLYSKAVFAWVGPLLRTGFRRLLSPADFYQLDENMNATVIKQQFDKFQDEKSFFWSCFHTLKWSLLSVVIPRLALLVFTIAQPLAVTRFLHFLQDESQPLDYGYGLLGAYALIYLGIAFSNALFWQCNGSSVTILRALLVSVVFSKATELKITATDNAAPGTLMSTDVDVITRAARDMHDLWANLIQVGIASWLLSKQIGFASAGPIIISVIALAITVYCGPIGKRTRGAWFVKTQKRVGVTSAMLGDIKSIKMSGLGTHLAKTITALRIDEIAASRPFRVLSAITSSTAQMPQLLSPVVAFAMYLIVRAREGGSLDPTKIFASLSYIILFTQPLFSTFEVIFNMSAAWAAFERIQTFISTSSRTEYREFIGRPVSIASSIQQGEQNSDLEMRILSTSAIPMPIYSDRTEAVTMQTTVIELCGASYAWSKERKVLDDIDLDVKESQLVMLTGPVASGKTTLLHGIIGEVPHAKGTTRIRQGRVSWCDQNPWITNQTIQDNIVGFTPFNQKLYDEVVRACELEQDFVVMPHGDMTLVGSKGQTLSGGQKQRISLARSIYSRPDIALFDDVFSGLDNETAVKIFRKLFDKSDGLLRKWGSTIVLATQSIRFLASADLICSLDLGKIAEKGTLQELLVAAGPVASMMLLANQSRKNDNETGATRADHPEKIAPQFGDKTVYRSYLASMGLPFAMMLLFVEIAWAFLQTFPTVWLNFWAGADSQEHGRDRNGYYLGIYAFLQAFGVLWFAGLIWFAFVVVTARSGMSLHNKLLNTVLKYVQVGGGLYRRLPTKSVEMANKTRFSQDIGYIDNQLPLALVGVIATFFQVLGMAGLLAASTRYVAISFPFLAVFYYYLQSGYLRTSRQLRLLDLEEKAPVYSQFLETLFGLTTIRALGWSECAIMRNHELLDRSQKPYYLLIMVQHWLVLALDLSTTVQALLVVGFAIKLRGSISVGLTGVSLVQLISMSETLSLLIRSWVSLEISVSAVARISQFEADTPEEDLPGENHQPPAEWPEMGHVIFENISASYEGNEDNKALDGISLEIRPGEKIGICGRTGSGKSSIILLLLRLLDQSSGTVIVDSVPLTSIPRETIRQRIIAVSQDQFALPGSVRANADPFGMSSGDLVKEALETVGLLETVSARGGLDAEVSDDMFSHGQRQLFCLARALLRIRTAGQIVLLDEATSSLDEKTEAKIREVIFSHFTNHTVIAIAHCLETVVDFDRVVILDKGCVAEIGNPGELLQQAGTRFRALWDASRHFAS